MKIIEIKPLENGGHRNQTGTFFEIPEGWAVIPDAMETPNFPFGDVEVKDEDVVKTEIEIVEGKKQEVEKVIGTRKVVSKWIEGVVPKSEPIPKPTIEPSVDDVMNILLGVAEDE
jgi:hypothetical protein